MDQDKDKRHVAVCGGGLVGMAAAVIFAMSGYQVRKKDKGYLITFSIQTLV